MAFDGKRGEVLLFGGISNDPAAIFPRALWAWNGSAWRCMPGTGPVGRMDAHLAWDESRDRLVLFGGRQLTRDRQSIFLRDTWEWDGAAWTRVDTAGPGPRVHGAMAYDPARRAIVLHGGGGAEAMLTDTWEWRDGRWRMLDIEMPAGALGNSLSAMPSALILVAAQRDSTPGCVDQRRATLYQLGAGRPRTLAGRGPCFSPQAPAVPIADGVLLFAGWNSRDVNVPAESWAWHAGTWRQLEGVPPRRRGAAMAWDSRRGRAVLYGGEGDEGLRADVWESDGSRWVRVGSGDPEGH